MILPGSTKNEAFAAVDRLRHVVAQTEWSSMADNLQVTFSAGVAEVRQNDAPDDTLSRADAALYRAKGAGRNWVMRGKGAEDPRNRNLVTCR